MISDLTEQDQRTALVIEQLDVERLEGIKGAFALGPFVRGINLILGPNASGKSRTAHALQTLIWPSHSELGAALTGVVTVGSAEWRVRTTERNASYIQNGNPSEGPPLATHPAANSDRYLLTLHDLLRADSHNLAELIQQESAGGYDMRRARDIAGFPKKLDTRGGRQQEKALKDMRSKTREIRSRYQALAESEKDLENLDRNIQAANAAARRDGLIVQAIEHADACKDISVLDALIAEYPAAMSAVTGNERDELERIAKVIATLDEERVEHTLTIANARRELESVGFALEIPPVTLIPELRARSEEFTRSTHLLEQQQKVLSEQHGRIERAIGLIDGRLNSDQLEHLESTGLGQLADVMREEFRAQSQLDAQLQLERWVGDTDVAARIDDLRTGIDRLYERLRLVGSDKGGKVDHRTKWILIVAAIAIASLGLMLAIEVQIAYGLAAILAVLMVWAAFRKVASSERDLATSIEQQYGLLGLPQPTSWSSAGVSEVIHELRGQLASAELDRQKAERWASLESLRDEAAQSVESAKARRFELEQLVGTTLPAPEWEQLNVLAAALRQWREANEQYQAAKLSVERTSLQRSDVLSVINQEFAQIGLPDASDSVEVQASLAELEVRLNRARSASDSINRCEMAISGGIQTRLLRARRDSEAIYNRLEIEMDDSHALRDRAEMFPGWTKHRSDRELAIAKRDLKRVQLLDVDDLLQLDREQLERHRTETLTIAETKDALVERRAVVLEQGRLARQAHDLEDALASEQQAVAILNSSRDERLQSAVNLSVWSFVANRSRNLNRPPVYRLADELFNTFTSGAYGLEFGDESEPKFQARDRSTGIILDLDQLSSGTRVQLLMAVRLAFIEQSESGVRLPLILDETFANTDDLRIDAIMDATIEISRRGRQIFYFTAQYDEIQKWTARIQREGSDIAHSFTDLADRRGLAAFEQPVQPAIAAGIFQRPAPPADLDYEGAREFLEVPPIDPWAPDLDHASLWYFITDVQLLCAAREFHVFTWGRYIATGRALLQKTMPDYDGAFEHALVRHRAIETAVRYWRIGRGTPLAPADIVASSSFAKTMVNEVVDICRNAGWDGAVSIARLRTNPPTSVTSRRIDKFVEWLEQEGKLSVATQLPATEIRSQVIVSMFDEMPIGELDQLLQSLEFPISKSSSEIQLEG